MSWVRTRSSESEASKAPGDGSTNNSDRKRPVLRGGPPKLQTPPPPRLPRSPPRFVNAPVGGGGRIPSNTSSMSWRRQPQRQIREGRHPPRPPEPAAEPSSSLAAAAAANQPSSLATAPDRAAATKETASSKVTTAPNALVRVGAHKLERRKHAQPETEGGASAPLAAAKRQAEADLPRPAPADPPSLATSPSARPAPKRARIGRGVGGGGGASGSLSADASSCATYADRRRYIRDAAGRPGPGPGPALRGGGQAGRPRPARRALGRSTLVPPSRTPVCPAWVAPLLLRPGSSAAVTSASCRGQDRCPYRHDVPLEWCRPTCRHFQRHGSCDRVPGLDDAVPVQRGGEGGEPSLPRCPYRHVKVGAGAGTCPSFDRLGYCPDPLCGLWHVAVANKPDRSARRRSNPSPKADAPSGREKPT
jgi:hypothetical protein